MLLHVLSCLYVCCVIFILECYCNVRHLCQEWKAYIRGQQTCAHRCIRDCLPFAMHLQWYTMSLPIFLKGITDIHSILKCHSCELYLEHWAPTDDSAALHNPPHSYLCSMSGTLPAILLINYWVSVIKTVRERSVVHVAFWFVCGYVLFANVIFWLAIKMNRLDQVRRSLVFVMSKMSGKKNTVSLKLNGVEFIYLVQ